MPVVARPIRLLSTRAAFALGNGVRTPDLPVFLAQGPCDDRQDSLAAPLDESSWRLAYCAGGRRQSGMVSAERVVIVGGSFAGLSAAYTRRLPGADGRARETPGDARRAAGNGARRPRARRTGADASLHRGDDAEQRQGVEAGTGHRLVQRGPHRRLRRRDPRVDAREEDRCDGQEGNERGGRRRGHRG